MVDDASWAEFRYGKETRPGQEFVFLAASSRDECRKRNPREIVPRQESFREKQMQYPRVRTAYSEYFNDLRSELDTLGIGDFDLFLRAFKADELIEVWIKDKEEEQFQLLRTYTICSSSGKAGPKRRRGDLQVPEGFYHINVFNPYSNFYLSLGIIGFHISNTACRKYSVSPKHATLKLK